MATIDTDNYLSNDKKMHLCIFVLIHNSELKNLYITKKSQGKSKKEAIIAVSRKLATIIYAIFKYNTPYNPNRVFAKS